MNGLVNYASSDEEREDDLPGEPPAKIARIEPQTAVGMDDHTKASKTTSQEQQSSAAKCKVSKEDSKSAITTATSIPSNFHGLEGDVGPAPGPARPSTATIDSADIDNGSLSPYSYERQRLRELTMPPVPDFSIPDSPPHPSSDSEEAARLATTTKKFSKFLDLKKQGVHFNARLEASASLRNPGLLSKLTQFANLSREDSYASSLSNDVRVPTTWNQDCYVDSLVRRNEKRERKRLAERERLDFVPASSAQSSRKPEVKHKHQRQDKTS